MPIVKCLNCGKISGSETDEICLRCNADLRLSRLAAKSGGGFQLRLPATLTPVKLGAVAAALVIGVLAVNFLWSLKTERAQKNAEKKQAEMIASFDYFRFDNDPASIDNAFKLMPAKFNVKPPEPEAFKADLSSEMSKKNHDNYTSRQQQTGTFEQTQKLSPTYNQGQVIGRVGDAVMTTGGPGPTSVTTQFKKFEKIETKHANKYVVIDVSVTDYNYVKAPGDKLICFVKYSAKMGHFQTSSVVLPFDPTQPAQAQDQNLGRKIKDWTAKENARYEYENDKWLLKQAGITELEKLRQIDELRSAAKTAAPASAVK